MSRIVDWAKYVSETEKEFAAKIEAVEISNHKPKERKTTKVLEQCSLPAKLICKGLAGSKNGVEVLRKDQNVPLYLIKSFDHLNLNPNLLKGVYELGFNAPSKFQEIALPILLAEPPQNLITVSLSGIGQRAGFVLAMLSKVDINKTYPQILCLSSTYELAIRTGEVAARMAKFCPEIKMKLAVRGAEVPRKVKLTEHIIIGTPGKILDWFLKFQVFDMKKISVFVLEDVDLITTQGSLDQSIKIYKNLSPACQMMFFSETYDQEVIDFAEHIIKNPITVRWKIDEEILENISQYCVRCRTRQEKYKAVTNIFGTVMVGQAIIYCRSRKTTAWLFKKMSPDGHVVAFLSGDLTEKQQVDVLDRFRQGQEKVLITTPILLKSIRLEQVAIVVHFDLPVDCNGKPDCETYFHQIRRTGKFGKKGIAINLVESDQAMEICEAIQKHFGNEIHYLNADDSAEIEKIRKLNIN